MAFRRILFLNILKNGILVEPLPVSFSKLTENYKESLTGKIFENIAISSYDGNLLLYLPQKNDENEDYFTKIVSQNKAVGLLTDAPVDEIFVPCLSLNSLVRKHNVTEIDLLIIDIEGYEIEVLTEYHFEVMPKIIYIETRFYNYDCLVKQYDKYQKMGYRIFPERDNCLFILK